MSAIFDCFERILRFRVFSFARIYKDGIKYQFILHETHVRVTIQLPNRNFKYRGKRRGPT